MLSTRRVRRVTVIGGLGALVATQVLAGVAGAGAQGLGGGVIRPNQVFGALVNGKNGVGRRVVITMVCPGSSKPGSKGHPAAGQTMTVFQPEVIEGSFGNTGAHGREIGAFFFAPPPSASAASSGAIFFNRYVTKKIPTSEVLPCSGKGQIYFVPLPMSPASEKDVVVRVSYMAGP